MGKSAGSERIDAVTDRSEVTPPSPRSSEIHPGLGFRIRRNIARPAADLVARYRLFDTPDVSDLASPHATAVRSQALRFVQKIARHFDNLSYLRPQEKLLYLWDEAKLALTSLLNPGGRRFAYTSSLGSWQPLSGALGNGREVNFSRLVYLPSVYPGRVTLLRASKLLAGTVHDLQLGWGSLAADGVEVHEVPGYYRFLNEPRVRLLAERLGPCLIRAQTAREG